MDKSEDESDEVVYESDVFLSKVFHESLYLFDYPSKNTNGVEKTSEEYECLSARIKPNQQKIEMEIGINIDSNSYDKSRGEQIAFNVDGRANANDALFKNPFMDKYMVCGSKARTRGKNYSLGVWKNGQFNVIPFHSILEMFPNLVHMDKMDTQAKKAQNPDEEEEEEVAVAVTVRFEGANADRNKEIREKSYQHYQQKYASEPWVNLNYHPLGSNLSKLECQKMMCGQMYNNTTSSFLSTKDYLKRLVPELLRQSENSSDDKEENEIIAGKPLSDQIKYLLQKAHVLTFSMLFKKLAIDIDDASVERLLHQMAVLVQGCWAVKSELLYPEDYISPNTGLSSKILINARDYVLWLFTKSTYITRKEVLSVIHVPNEDFLDMITPLAIETNRRWEFKFPEDKDFIESHPEVYERQNMKWDLRYKKLVKDLNIGIYESEGGPSKVPFMATPRPRQKRHSRSSLSEGDESGAENVYGVKDFNKTKRACIPRKNSVTSPSKQGAKTKQFNFVSLDISPTFLETSPPTDLMAQLKDYVRDAMRTQYCMTFSDIKELVSQSHLNGIVNRSDFVTLLEETLLDCGAQKLKNKWPQNTTPETLYAFAKFGNKLDRYRNALLDLFSTTARARMNLFVKKVEDELREIVSESDCRLLFEEYCVHKSGFYYLKGTIALDS